MNWRDVGRRFKESWGQDGDVLKLPGYTVRFNPTDSSAPADGELHSFSASPPNDEFAAAVEHYKQGHDAHLIDYLHSDRPVGESERRSLARLLALPPADVRFEHKQRVRFAGYMARTFYREWRDECRRLGVSYRGAASEMQWMCAESVAACVEGVTTNDVLDIMRRAYGRRCFDEKQFTVVVAGITLELNPKFPRQN
jgi:hypothetical protein